VGKWLLEREKLTVRLYRKRLEFDPVGVSHAKEQQAKSKHDLVWVEQGRNQSFAKEAHQVTRQQLRIANLVIALCGRVRFFSSIPQRFLHQLRDRHLLRAFVFQRSNNRWCFIFLSNLNGDLYKILLCEIFLIVPPREQQQADDAEYRYIVGICRFTQVAAHRQKYPPCCLHNPPAIFRLPCRAVRSSTAAAIFDCRIAELGIQEQIDATFGLCQIAFNLACAKVRS